MKCDMKIEKRRKQTDDNSDSPPETTCSRYSRFILRVKRIILAAAVDSVGN